MVLSAHQLDSYFTDTNSGTIDLDGSTSTYTVTYTTSGTCTNTAGFEITITGQDSATIAYGSVTIIHWRLIQHQQLLDLQQVHSLQLQG